MERCPDCMREHAEGVRYCPYCGYENYQPVNGNQLPVGTMLDNRYFIGTVIGVGGFGIIYKAWDNKLNTTVAVKECFPNGLVTRSSGQIRVEVVNNSAKEKQYKEKIRRFLVEAKTMARFSEHENIVHVFDYFEANNTAYFVMEYLDGCNLKDYMNNHKLSIEESVDIIAKIGSILKHMHSEGIIHRDINPNNIMICKNGNIKLIDFGTAWAPFGELSRRILIELTHGYAPPEQYQTNGDQGAWTDIYALCATLYTMITGKMPEESTDRDREDKMLSPRQINPEVPEWLDRTVMAGMAPDYHLRIQSTEELLNGLNLKKKILYPEELIKKQKRIRTVTIDSVIIILLLGIVGMLANSAFYHAWFVKNGMITIWLPDNSFGTSVEQTVENYETRYSGKKIDIMLIDEKEYSSRIQQAYDDGSLPDIFIVSETDYAAKECLADVSGILKDFCDDNHYLIRQHYEKLSENKVIPLSFETVVLYENTSLSEKMDKPYRLSKRIDLSKTKLSGDKKHTIFDASSRFVDTVISPEAGSNGMKNALSVFTDSDKQTVPYYFGSTSDRRMVQQSLAGYNKIYGVCDGEKMFAELSDTLCIGNRSFDEKESLIRLWLEYLLSEEVQRKMYLENGKPFPIERNTYNHYIGIINSLSFFRGRIRAF